MLPEATPNMCAIVGGHFLSTNYMVLPFIPLQYESGGLLSRRGHFGSIFCVLVFVDVNSQCITSGTCVYMYMYIISLCTFMYNPLKLVYYTCGFVTHIVIHCMCAIFLFREPNFTSSG